MGVNDYLDGVKIPCPACRRLIVTSVQFKVGSCYLNHYQLGDKISWGDDGVVNSPEAKGKDRFEYPVGIEACPDCVARYAWQYRQIRRELDAAGRLEFLDEPSAEAAAHPEPNQQDGVVLVDGIYPAWEWIRFELERLGAPVADSLETWEGTLVIKNDVLSEVIPAKEQSIPRRLSTAAFLSACLFEEVEFKPRIREIRSPQKALEEVLERQRMLCRGIEHIPEHDSSLSQWLLSNIGELAKLETANLDSCAALAANLNALGAGPGVWVRRDGGLGHTNFTAPFHKTLMEMAFEAYRLKAEHGVPYRVTLQIKKTSSEILGPGRRRVQHHISSEVRRLHERTNLPEPPPGEKLRDPRQDGGAFYSPPQGPGG